MSSHPIIETERLVLRPFEPSDAGAVQHLAGSREIASTTLKIPHPYPDGAAEEWISSHKGLHEGGKELNFAVVEKRGAVLLGAIALMEISEEHAHGEIGYWIGMPFWNKGFSTEAAGAVLRFGFEELGLHRIHAHCFIRNPASARVLEKIGMGYEGRRREAVRKWDVFEDVALYGILKSDWERQQEERGGAKDP